MTEINNRDDKELREKINTANIILKQATHALLDDKIGGLEFLLYEEEAENQILALLQQKCKECEYDPQAAEFGWFLGHGWIHPAELQPKIEEARRQERERIYIWSFECCPHTNGLVKAECERCWQALKE